MTEQKNSAPQPLSDEELDAVTGGATGFNPLYGLTGDFTSSAPNAVMAVGANPLYVAPAEPYVPLTVPQAAAPTPAPQPAPTPAPEPTVIPVTSDVFGGGSLNIAAPISTKITLTGTVTDTGGTTVQPTPGPQPEVLTLVTPQPTYTEVTATVNGIRWAGPNNTTARIDAGGTVSPLESAFGLSLVPK